MSCHGRSQETMPRGLRFDKIATSSEPQALNSFAEVADETDCDVMSNAMKLIVIDISKQNKQQFCRHGVVCPRGRRCAQECHCCHESKCCRGERGGMKIRRAFERRQMRREISGLVQPFDHPTEPPPFDYCSIPAASLHCSVPDEAQIAAPSSCSC